MGRLSELLLPAVFFVCVCFVSGVRLGGVGKRGKCRSSGFLGEFFFFFFYNAEVKIIKKEN